MRTVLRFKLESVLNTVALPVGAKPLGVTFNGKMGGIPAGFDPKEATPEQIEEVKTQLVPIVDMFVDVPEYPATATEPRTFLNVPVGQALPEGKELVFVGVAHFPQQPARIVLEQITPKKSKK